METPTRDPIIVYPVKPTGGSKWGNNELRFSLRSVQRFWRSPSGAKPKVFIISTADIPWVNREEVTIVPIRGYAEAILHAWVLAREHSPTGDYVWMNDDICFLQETGPADLEEAIHLGRMRPGRGEDREEVGGWRWKVIKVRDRCHELLGEAPLDFSTHSPYLFNAEKMEKVAGLFGLVYKTPLETAYYNFWGVPSRRSDNRLVKHNPPESLPLDVSDKRFLNFSDAGLNPLMRGFLHGLFPTYSRYEIKETPPK